MSLGAFLYSCKVPGYLTTQCGCEGDQQTASHVLAKLRHYSEEKWDFWQQKERDMKNPMGEITLQDMLTKHVRSSAHFSLRTGLLLQYERLSVE